MALTGLHKETLFGIGDKVKVHQKIREGEKERTQVFEGMVIAIKGGGESKTLTVRKVGEAGIGIERIFPLSSPFLEKVEVVRQGRSGVRHAKLYYIRGKSPRQIEAIFQRAQSRLNPQTSKNKTKKKKRK